MEIADFISTTVLVAVAAFGIFKLVRAIYKLFYGDIVLTNHKTGKSVTLGRHHRDGLSKELLEVLE